MRRNSFFLPALGMGLLYSSQYLGMIIGHLRGTVREGGRDLGLMVYFAVLVPATLVLYCLVKKGSGIRFERFRPLAAFPALAACVCLALPFLPEAVFARLFMGWLPVLSVCITLFIPVGLFLFFRAAPAGREGFCFSLILVGSELLWALFFSLIGGMAGSTPNPQVLHLFSLICWMVGGAGLCFALTLARAAPGVSELEALPPAGTGTQARGKRAVIALTFAAGALVCGIVGLHMGLFGPRMAFSSELISVPYFAFLLLLPLAGRMLDENPARIIPAVMLGLGVLFFLGLAKAHGLISALSLFLVLNFLQQSALLAAYTATLRLPKQHSAFLLLLPLVHCLYLAQFAGVGLRLLVEPLPYGLTAASLLLTLGTACCLWRLRRLLTDDPAIWAAPRLEKMPEAESGPEDSFESRLAAFTASYGLSEQETRVMEMLAQNRSPEEIAAFLTVKTSTVRTYITRLMQKTGTHSRAALMARYAAHDPAADSIQ